MLAESQLDFLTQAAQAAVIAERVTSCPAELTVAQALVESAWGTRMPCWNALGIKHTDGPDNYQLTKEYLNGSWKVCRLDFEAYDSLADCFIAHGRLLTEGAPYKDAWEHYREDPAHDLDTLIGAVGRRYATDPNYTATIMGMAHGPHVTAAIAAARLQPAVVA